jgi:hypothetical protein
MTSPADDPIHLMLKAAIEVEMTTLFWGSDTTFTPYVCDKIFGDGRALLVLWPLNTRPCYYVIRIDSGSPIDDDAFHDLLEDGIYAAIEDQFGTAHDDEDETGDGEPWPAFDDGSGCTWDRMDWPAGVGEVEPHAFDRCTILRSTKATGD